MAWLWSKTKKLADEQTTSPEETLSVEAGNIEINLNSEQSRAFEDAETELGEVREKLLKVGEGNVTRAIKDIGFLIDEESDRLVALAKRPADALEIMQTIEIVDEYQESRKLVIEEREKRIQEAVDAARAAIKEAEEIATESLDKLQEKFVDEISGRLRAVRNRVQSDVELKSRVVRECLEETIAEIENAGGDALHHVVKDANGDLRKIAEIYGRQVALLFMALANDRVKSIESASKINDFDVRLEKNNSSETENERLIPVEVDTKLASGAE